MMVEFSSVATPVITKVCPTVHLRTAKGNHERREKMKLPVSGRQDATPYAISVASWRDGHLLGRQLPGGEEEKHIESHFAAIKQAILDR